jgi:hypothetical protein
MKTSGFFALALVSMIVLSVLPAYVLRSVNAAPRTVLQVINPLTSDTLFNFNISTKKVGDTFIINITVANVTDLQNWQIKLTWNASLLEYVNVTLPADHVFAASGKAMFTPTPSAESGSVTWGCTYINDPYWTFNGTGRLCQVELNMTQEVNEMSPTEVNCTLALADMYSNTFLMDGSGQYIGFTTVNGFYDYKWVPPFVYPTLYIRPPLVKPSALGETFAIEVWVKEVDAGWSIVGFNFSLMWNTTFMTPTLGPSGRYFDNGTFLENFQYYTNGVLYTAEINTHDRPPPLTALPEDYNYSRVAATLLPDSPPNPQFHAPFASGEGKLVTMYFKAVYETAFPVEDWTWIEFVRFEVDEDTCAVNRYLHAVQVSTEQCHYCAPARIVGDIHDVAVTGVNPSKSVIGQGYSANISITVKNQGNFTEVFNITVCANMTVIAMRNDVVLPSGNSTVATFTWNTTGLTRGNYTMNANVSQVAGEIDVQDNTLVNGTVLVGVPCDITGPASRVPDGVCNMRDIGYICSKFGSAPYKPGWDPNCDVSGSTPRVPDGRVDMRDIGEACTHFGERGT